MGRRQAGNPIRRPETRSRGNRDAPGHPGAGGGGQAAAATDAGAAAGQPPMAETLSTNAATKGDSTMKESCGNDGAVESVEIQKQDFPSFHSSLEISQRRRDSHIPTAPVTRAVQKWKTKNRFPTFPPPFKLG